MPNDVNYNKRRFNKSFELNLGENSKWSIFKNKPQRQTPRKLDHSNFRRMNIKTSNGNKNTLQQRDPLILSTSLDEVNDHKTFGS